MQTLTPGRLLVVFVAGLLCCSVCPETTSPELKYACYGTLSKCSFLNLTCGEGLNAFILSAEYGFQPNSSGCAGGAIKSCNDSTTCCMPMENSCFKNYDDKDFAELYWKCWKQGCDSYPVEWDANGCGDDTNKESGFVRLHQVCLDDDLIIEVDENRTISGPVLAVLYNSSKNYERGFWQCKVITTTISAVAVNITAVKEPNKRMGNNCSMISINGTPLFVCDSTNVTYSVFQNWTGFAINFYCFPEDDFSFGWVLVQAPNGTILMVTCGEHCGNDITNCTDVNSTLTTAATDSTIVDSSTAPPQTSSTEAASTEAKTTEVASSTESATHTSQSDVTQSTVQTSLSTTLAANEDSNTGAIVGGVVAAVVVVVAAVVGVLCFVRRKRQQLQQEGKPPKMAACTGRLPLTSLQSSSSSGPCPAQPGTAGIRDHVTPDFPAKSHDYFVVEPQPSANGHVSKASERDYDLLGQKKSQSSSSNPTATYGHLGEVGGGGEDTDYNYDHLAKGRQAAPDVIDSDYNTPYLTSEGDYNVAGIPKKQHVITGSDYDVAQIVTSDGDYNRVDFQGKKQHVITGSDYDVAQIVTSEGDYNRVDFQGKKQRVITGSDYDSAEIVTSDGDYNKVDFQGKKQRAITGSDYNELDC